MLRRLLLLSFRRRIGLDAGVVGGATLREVEGRFDIGHSTTGLDWMDPRTGAPNRTDRVAAANLTIGCVCPWFSGACGALCVLIKEAGRRNLSGPSSMRGYLAGPGFGKRNGAMEHWGHSA